MQKDNNYKVDSDIKVEVVSDIDQNTTEETKQEEYSRKQAAYKLGISISTLDRLIKKGDARLLPRYYKIGSQYRFLKKSVEEFKEIIPTILGELYESVTKLAHKKS